MPADPFALAIRDFHYDDQTEPLIQRDGADTIEHPIERFYFGTVTAEDEGSQWLESWLHGPLLDMGAGVGRHTLYFQEQIEVVAIEVSDALVEVMGDRGVTDARHVDMFDLRGAFERDRFRSALAHGTQLGLAGSMQGLRQFLGDLAFVTTTDGTAVLDGYDPTREGTPDLLGYRPDPTPGLAFRVVTFEYEGEVGKPLLFRLFSPDRLREATVGTGWDVADIWRSQGENANHYRAALTKG